MRIESETVSIHTIARLYSVSGKGLAYQYKEFISDFREWEQLDHAAGYVLFKENMDHYLSIDEACLSQGELYTITTNKEAHGGKGALVAMIQGTNADKIIPILKLLPRGKRKKVKEMTMDLSPTMKKIATACFPNAVIFSDRFHVQKLMTEAISDMRIDYRWMAIDLENNYLTICNYFKNRSTNASAESFNAKVKAFRAQFRGVRDIPFFIYRLTKVFA